MKIIIDSGHGGSDPGAVAFGTFEKDINLIFAKKLADKLSEKGYEVDTTLINDINYDSRVLTSLIRESGAKLCISCHNNALNGTVRGMEVIHSIHSDGTLGNLILNNASTTGYTVRTAYNRESAMYPGTDYYFIIRETYPDVETIIIEFGFMDNSKDFALLNSTSWQNRLIGAVVDAVSSYLPLSAPVQEEHWAKTNNDELMEVGILYDDHSDTLDNPATEGLVISIVNRLRKELLKNE